MDTEVVITYEPQKVTRVYAQPVTARAVVAGAPEEVADAAAKHEAVGVLADGVLLGLDETIPGRSASVELVTTGTAAGQRAVARTLVFVLQKAAATFQDWLVAVAHAADTHSVVCTVNGGARAVTASELDALRAEMARVVAADAPVRTVVLSRAEAVAYFAKRGSRHSAALLAGANAFGVPCVGCDGHYELARGGPYAGSTGVRGMADFDLLPCPPGGFPGTFILSFGRGNGNGSEKGNGQVGDASCGKESANEATTTTAASVMVNERLVSAYTEAAETARDVLGVENVGEVNARVLRDGPCFKALCEELHGARLVAAAQTVRARYDAGARLVLIAGPSSSGKTTFAHKLAMQLRVAGLQPLILSVDNYYKAHADCPRDADGKLDFEVVEALRVDLLNDHLVALFRGDTVRSPVFDFHAGKPSDTATIPATLPPHGVVIMEGIHCLNDRLTPRVPAAMKVKIFVAPLSPLHIDEAHPVANETTRLIRRIVRDYRSRGYSAEGTLSRWASVRRGEDLHIFPFMKDADVVYNTSLAYEMNILKAFCLPLLASVKPDSEYYQLTRELVEFMDNFVSIPYHDVPAMSLLREFIGDSFYNTG